MCTTMRFAGRLLVLASVANVGTLAMQQTGRLSSLGQQDDKRFKSLPLGSHRGQGTWVLIDSQGDIVGQQANSAADLAAEGGPSGTEQTSEASNVHRTIPGSRALLHQNRQLGRYSDAQIDSQGAVGIARQQPNPAAELASEVVLVHGYPTPQGSHVSSMMPDSQAHLHENQKVLSDHSDAKLDSEGSVATAGQQSDLASAELATKAFPSNVEQTPEGSHGHSMMPKPLAHLHQKHQILSDHSDAQIHVGATSEGSNLQQIEQGSVGIGLQQPHPVAELLTKGFPSNVERTFEGSGVQQNEQGSVGIDLQQRGNNRELPTRQLASTGELSSEDSNAENRTVLSNHPGAKAGEFVLPIWAKVVCGSLTTILIMIIFFCVKSRMSQDVPSNMDGERLHIVLQETIERVNVLKQELEVHIQEQQPVPAGEDPELRAASAEAQNLQERTEMRAREIREAASLLAEQRHQLVAGAARVQGTFKEVIEGGRVRVEDFSKMEATGLFQKVEEAVAEANIPAWEVPAWMTSTEEEDFLTLPPLVNLIQGALASRSIHMVSFSCRWKIVVDVIMLTLSVLVVAKEWHAPCPDKQFWVWHIGLLASNSLDLLARIVVVRWCHFALGSLTARRADMEHEERRADRSLFDQMSLLKLGSDSYFESFFKYNNIVGSWLYSFLEVMILFHLCWGSFGLWLSIMHIMENSLSCNAKLGLRFLHCYSCSFVILLTWNVLTLILTVIGRLSGSTLVSGAILKGAKNFDDNTMNGIPLALTLVESFVLTNSAGSLSMSQREVKDDLRQLSADLELLDKQLIKKKRAAEQVDEVAASISSQEEYMNRYQDMMDQSFKQAKPLIGLIAANVRTEDVENTVDRNEVMAARTAGIGMALNARRMAANARRQVRGIRRHNHDPGVESF